MWKDLPVYHEKGKTLLRVHVIPQASKTRIGEMREGPHGERYLTLYVTAPPTEGKANAAIVALLSKYLGVPKRLVLLQKGTKQRYKIVSLSE
ncbi:MAG: DUF167 domain-containing protein [Holosporales bacterium]|jgi:uncharacterized protein (TIGR00251 family)|nr:DUF167 domain-containing protein [Holosporales bacterium]